MAQDPESANSLPRRFYEKANEQLMASRIQTGAYTALDAAATLQLVSFSHFVGGIRGWEKTLQIAGDWYESTGITRHEAPLRAMWELNLSSKFASRLVVWYDVFSCEFSRLHFDHPIHLHLDDECQTRHPGEPFWATALCFSARLFQAQFV